MHRGETLAPYEVLSSLESQRSTTRTWEWGPTGPCLANSARGWRIGPGTDPNASSCDSAPRFDQRLFFVAWFLASQAVTASGSGNPAPLGSRTFWRACRRTRDLCAVLSLTRFAVGSALSIDSGLRAPPGSPATPWGVTAGGPAPPESHRSGRRSAPHTIRLLFEVGSSFCRLPCFVPAKVLGARIWVLFLFLRLFCLPWLGQSLHSRMANWFPKTQYLLKGSWIDKGSLWALILWNWWPGARNSAICFKRSMKYLSQYGRQNTSPAESLLVRSLRTLWIFEHTYIIVTRRLLHRNIRTIALWGTKPDTKSTTYQINHIQNKPKSTMYKINHIPNQLPDQRSFLRYQTNQKCLVLCVWQTCTRGEFWVGAAVGATFTHHLRDGHSTQAFKNADKGNLLSCKNHSNFWLPSDSGQLFELFAPSLRPSSWAGTRSCRCCDWDWRCREASLKSLKFKYEFLWGFPFLGYLLG